MFSKKIIKPIIISLSVAFLVLIIALGFLISNVHTLRNTERKILARSPFSIFLGNQEPISTPTENDVQNIDEWMTFGYINHQFGLPEGMFADKLNIQDNKYPKIPIGIYAKKNDLVREEFIIQVRAIVSDFISQVR